MSLISVHRHAIEISEDDLITKEAFERFAEEVSREVVATIKNRTAEGRYLSGSTPGHETYNASYARAKKKPQSPVTLRDTGSMMNAIVPKHQPRGVYRWFAGGEIADPRAGRLAAIHNDVGAGAGAVVRRWFDITQEEIQTALRRAGDNTEGFDIDVG